MDTFFGFRTAGKKIAIDFDRPLVGDIDPTRARAALKTLRFVEKRPDLIATARGRIGVSAYRRGAHTEEAPGIFDCSSFTKWLYGRLGIWLPRRAIDQRDIGAAVAFKEAREGDLVFTAGSRGRFCTDPGDNVGHVGIVTDRGTVIHAAGTRAGIVESPLGTVREQRGVRRYLTEGHDIRTYMIPSDFEIEHERDVWWKILQTL